MMKHIIKEIENNIEKINTWLKNKKKLYPQIIYNSIDIRESDYKIASIDTNLFPAGFNNLCRLNENQLGKQLSLFINNNFKNKNKVLLFCEDHTRNQFYLDNIYQLSKTIKNAGFKLEIATFFKDHPTICSSDGYLNFKMRDNQPLKIYCLDYIIKNKLNYHFDVCILNNDLSDGNFEKLISLNTPLIPRHNLGWFNRKKSTHIHYLNSLTSDMIKDCKLDIDSWCLSTIYKKISLKNDINDIDERKNLAKEASLLLNKIKLKYQKYKIETTPYLVLKSDTGTYGMGVIKIESPDDIINLNRKNRNKMKTGKSSIPIKHLILQEGIPTTKTVNNIYAEEVIYHCNGEIIGGFYRLHDKKSNTDILNSTGMTFKSFCRNTSPCKDENSQTCVKKDISAVTYVIASLANIAAQIENQKL